MSYRSRLSFISAGVCIAIAGCSAGPGTEGASVLEPGTQAPAELTEIRTRTAENGAPGIQGAFVKNGRTVRFYTRRGPRIAIFEVLSGANEFEIDACFVNERGHTLVSVAGGHENTMPECPDVVEGGIEGEGADDAEGQAVVIAAMEALRRLPFRAPYRGEQRVLTGPLEFMREPPALDGAIVEGADAADVDERR